MKLALGTVQFGMNYGVSNVKGQVAFDEAEAIVKQAYQDKIDTLDTAHLYGSSERIVGEILAGLPPDIFKIITKLPGIKTQKISKETIIELEKSFNESLTRLKKDKIYGLLLHSGKDLLLEGGGILQDYLFKLKQSGKVKKIGISVYSPDELAQILEVIDIDIVQLPLNVFDQRFLHSRYLEKLHSQGVEVHTRSLFLQGLLLMPIEKSQAKFPDFASHLQNYDYFLKQYNLTPLECSLGFIKKISLITKALIGVTSVKELDEIIAVYHANRVITANYEELSCTDLAFIDPRMWK